MSGEFLFINLKKMTKKKTENKLLLPISIIVSSLIIAGALVFFGMQYQNNNPKNLDAAIEKGIEKYIAKQEAKMKEEREKAIAAKKAEQAKKIKNLPKVNENEYVAGAEKANITIVEYSDFECPFCKRFSETMSTVMKDLDGKVNRVFRHFPLPFHGDLAVEQAKAVECVGKLGGAEKFWKFNELVFKTTKSNIGMKAEELPTLAVKVGVNKAKFNTCLKDEAIAAKVQADIESGQKSGVEGTPASFIVNNKTGKVEFVNGMLPAAAMKAKIEAVMKDEAKK
ncbi:hypothetical protein CSB37_03800 [bacterium DOLZORAL124_38_8]|nr:MAG: hypothetical protein CSB37_03800 [bacterium DOLZORAL124_38_8]